MNTIIIELCKEDRQRLDKIIELLGQKPDCHKCVEAATANMTEGLKVVQCGAEPVTATEQPDPVNEHPIDDDLPWGQPEPVAEPEAPKYTKEDIQAKVRKLAAPGSAKRLEAKAIVQSYGLKVSDIPADKYDEVMAKLAELEG